MSGYAVAVIAVYAFVAGGITVLWALQRFEKAGTPTRPDDGKGEATLAVPCPSELSSGSVAGPPKGKQ